MRPYQFWPADRWILQRSSSDRIGASVAVIPATWVAHVIQKPTRHGLMQLDYNNNQSMCVLYLYCQTWPLCREASEYSVSVRLGKPLSRGSMPTSLSINGIPNSIVCMLYVFMHASWALEIPPICTVPLEQYNNCSVDTRANQLECLQLILLARTRYPPERAMAQLNMQLA